MIVTCGSPQRSISLSLSAGRLAGVRLIHLQGAANRITGRNIIDFLGRAQASAH